MKSLTTKQIGNIFIRTICIIIQIIVLAGCAVLSIVKISDHYHLFITSEDIYNVNMLGLAKGIILIVIILAYTVINGVILVRNYIDYFDEL